MNDYGYGLTVLIDDNNGSELICTLDSHCTLGERDEIVCKLNGNRKLPHKLEELSEHERRSCRSSVSVFGV